MSTDPNSPEIVASRLSEQEAMILIECLREEGVEARPWGTYLANNYGEIAPRECMQVVVRRSDAERARCAIEKSRTSLQTRPFVLTERPAN